jgi:hypothetical protein
MTHVLEIDEEPQPKVLGVLMTCKRIEGIHLRVCLYELRQFEEAMTFILVI